MTAPEPSTDPTTGRDPTAAPLTRATGGSAAAAIEGITRFLTYHRQELIAFRRHLHAHPELSYDEHATTDLVAERLRTAGLQPRILDGGCGLVCDIGTGREGPMVALRADIDALAMDDEKDVPYRSTRPGIAHACGHDVHTTVVLGAGLALAELLADVADPRELTGGVRLIFEPAEETLPSGATQILEAGALEGVTAIFGMHCDPKLEVGRVGVRTGAITSATDLIEIELNGPGGHTARPQLTVDLVSVAGRLAAELPSAARDGAAHLGTLLLVFGMMRSGDAANVIPAHALLRGTVRTPDRVVWDAAEPIVRRSIEMLLGDTGANWELHHERGTPPVVNTAAETERLAAMASSWLGSENVTETAQSFGGDSFAWYLDEVPGSYARLGVHDPALNEHLDLHSSTFDVHEDAIGVGVQVLASTALETLRSATAGR